MNEIKETVRKLNACYYKLRADLNNIITNRGSYADKRKAAEYFSHLDQVIKGFKTQIEELEEKLNPPLPNIPDDTPKSWNN